MNHSRDNWKQILPTLGIALGLLCIIYLSAASFSSIDQLQNHAGRVNHTNEVRFELERIIFLVRDAQAATRGYAIAGKEEFLPAFDEVHRLLAPKIADLAAQVADNPAQVRNVGVLKVEVQGIMALLEKTVSLRRNDNSGKAALALIANGDGMHASDRIRALVTQMQEREAELLVRRENRVVAGARDTKFLIVFGTLAVYLVLGGTFWMLVREVRQRKRADQALLEANHELLRHAGQLEQANKELESFSYSVSHDLRVPLRAVAGYAGMLAEDYEQLLDDEGKRLLRVICDNSKRMGLLIDDLLAFSRLGKAVLSATNINMGALAQNAFEELRGRDDDQAVHFILDPLPPSSGDHTLLRQVWINLISNAIKYSSKAATPEIRISGTSNADESIYSIQDNGVGFDMQYADKLFGVFQRLHSAEEFPGTGVGLAIVQRIVLRHGGRVWAEGVIDQGATFHFSLPHRG